MRTVSLLKWGIRMNFTVQWCEGKERGRDWRTKRGWESAQEWSMATQRREMHIRGAKMGRHRSYSEGYWMKVMKINTLIITILKIKIEDSTLVVLIFKCLQYIDQCNPVFRWALRGKPVRKSRRKKHVLQEESLKILISNTEVLRFS